MKLMKLILTVHLILLVVLVEAEPLGIITTDADDVMDPTDWNAPTRGKVMLFANQESGSSPYMSFTTDVTSELPVVLKELSGRFSPIERRDSRVYVFEDDMWEVKGRFSDA